MVNPLQLIATDDTELAVITLKARLSMCVIEAIRTTGMTQAQTAELLGVTQPRISSLMRGELSKFSVESLLELAINAGYKMSLNCDGVESINMRVEKDCGK